jgi:hypothetical protein
MNKTIQILSEICEKYRFEEKLLFVPSYSIGHQIGEYLAKTGTSWINLRTTTVSGYAQDLVSLDLSKNKIRLIDSHERLVIIEKLYQSDEKLGSSGCYFEGASEVPGILKCLGNTVHELRMGGLSHKSLDEKAFIIKEKGRELIRLLFVYDRFLEENRLIDHAGLINLAIDKIKKEGKSWEKTQKIMVLSDFPLTNFEKALIRLAGGKNLIVIDHTRPLSLEFPIRFFDAPEQIEKKVPEPENIDLLRWLYRPEDAPKPTKDNSVSMFHALGESNEIREVFRRILKDEIPLDDVEILVTSVDPYISMIYEIITSLDIPASFSGGVPITFTRPGRALILYLQWQAEDFQASHLRRLFSGGYLDLNRFDLEGEKPSQGRISRIIRDAKIGWGRDRYAARFKALEESYLSRAEEQRNQGEEEKAFRAKQAADRVAQTAFCAEKIMGTISYADSEENVSTKELCSGTFDFVKRYCRVASELDAIAKSRLLERLESLMRAPSLEFPAKEAAERIIKIVGDISVDYSNPKPGAVHVAHYRSGGHSGRSHSYVLGLDQNRFPGLLLQDPVILDIEREQLGSQMVLASQLLDENVYLMAKILSGLQGSVTLSYSCRDLKEDRELFPSSLLLGIYRLITANYSGDYQALIRFLGEPAGFIPGSGSVSLNDWEWWLAQKQTRYGSDSVHASYQNLYDGEKAETERGDDVLTEYDGWVPSSEGTIDPMCGDVFLSSSRLENLSKCPFAYFIRYVLGVEPLEEMEKDMGKWLDPLQRGQLLHTVFQKIMETLKAKGELPNFKKHSVMLEAVAMEEVEEWKAEVPPASELAYNREVEDIKLTMEIFLKDEERHCQNREPCFFELSFGIGEETIPGISTEDPVEIKLKPKGSFKIRGRIDRVDRIGEHEYEVWDYKTGSTWGYKDQGYLNQGKHLQHALYSLATEHLLRKNLDKKARVIRAGYFFPGPKGGGRRISRDQPIRKELYEVLGNLFELLRNGVFLATDDKDSCGKFCDYVAICGSKETALERAKRKISEDDKASPFRRLKDYA